MPQPVVRPLMVKGLVLICVCSLPLLRRERKVLKIARLSYLGSWLDGL